MRHKFWLLPVIMVLLLLQPAVARARDEVISGVFRCAAIGDTRLWLDCFYGAAQPLRAELQMQPVSPEQARLAVSPPTGGPVGDMTARYQVTTAVMGCNSLSDSRDWLDCYYGAAQPVRAQLGLSRAPQAHPQAPPNGPILRAGAPIVSHNGSSGWSRMTAYSFNRYGIFTVTLANGQVWRQLSGDTDLAHWTKPAGSYAAQIVRGALGSFNLKVKGGSQTFKVEQAN